MIGGIGDNYQSVNFYSNGKLNPLADAGKEEKGQNPLSDSVKGEELQNPLFDDKEKDYFSEKAAKRAGLEECETCKNRKYQDGSDENVSFKAPRHVSPQAAGAAVRGHEAEHVSNAYDKAAMKNGKVIQASVSIHTSICPECGRTYVSGGETRTRISYNNQDNPYQQEKMKQDAENLAGNNFEAVF